MKTIALIFIMIFISACTTSHNNNVQHYNINSEYGLEKWIDNDLIPYLSYQLTTHHMLKGQKILILSIKENEVQYDIDGLTSNIRDKIANGLMQQHGIHIVCNNAKQEALRSDHIKMDKITYYLGIDARYNKINNKLCVSIKCLNVKDKTWVSGFGKNWKGDATKSEIDSLNKTRKDTQLEQYAQHTIDTPITEVVDHETQLGRYVQHTDNYSVYDYLKDDNKTSVPVSRYCFHDFTNVFKKRIYTVLKNIDGVTDIKGIYNICKPSSDCICYEIHYNKPVQEINNQLYTDLRTSGISQFDIIEDNEQCIKIVFNGGFD